MTRPSPRPWIAPAELALLATGIVLRVLRYLDGRPLWYDEAAIALNVLSRPFDGFFRPLDGFQISPLGFLWSEWLATRLLGPAEWALRLIPFLAGVAALIAFARLARRILEPAPALFATALAAFSPLLIYYSGELKSYSFDCLAAILLMHATLTIAERGPQWASVMRWGAAATFAVLMSTPAPFVVAGCGLALLLVREVRAPRALFRLVIAGTPAVLLGVLHLLTLYDAPDVSAFMRQFWSESFLPLAFPGALLRAAVLSRVLFEALLFDGSVANLLPPKTLTALILGTGVGLILIARRSWVAVTMLVVPVLLAAGAALAGRWPLHPRLLLFAVPAVFLAIPAGLAFALRVIPGRWRSPVLGVIGLAIVAVMAWGIRREWRLPSPRFLHLPEALEDIRRDPGEAPIAYLSANLIPACRYYTTWLHGRSRGPAEAGGNAECSVPGMRTILGFWPKYDGQGTIANKGAPMSSEWLQQEAGFLVANARRDFWVIVGISDLREPFARVLEQKGVRPTVDRSRGFLRVVRYRATIFPADSGR